MEIEIKQLVWDGINVNHIWEKHHISREEVEELAYSLEKLVSREHSNGRIIIIGLTKSGKMITSFLSPKTAKGSLYPVTARSASIRERRMFRQKFGGEKK